jgi:hypothetical protein
MCSLEDLTLGVIGDLAILARRDRDVTCLLRDLYCAGCPGMPELSGSVTEITDAPQVPPVTASMCETLQ